MKLIAQIREVVFEMPSTELWKFFPPDKISDMKDNPSFNIFSEEDFINAQILINQDITELLQGDYNEVRNRLLELAEYSTQISEYFKVKKNNANIEVILVD